MKTKVITGLKKEVLIVEAKDEKIAWAIIFQKYGVKAVSDYTLLGKPDEIKEDDLEGLFKEYKDGYFSFNKSLIKYNTKIRAFNKLIESEIHWKNPFHDLKCSVIDMTLGQWENKKKFLEAQEKTYDRNRVKIFVKN